MIGCGKAMGSPRFLDIIKPRQESKWSRRGDIPLLLSITSIIYPLLVLAVLMSLLFGAISISFSLSPELLSAVKLSLISATLATSIALLLGVPLAYLLAKAPRSLLTSVAETFVELPVAVPPLVSGLALLLLLTPLSPVGGALASAGISILFTLKGAVLAQLIIAAPFLIRGAQSSFEMVDRRVEGVARVLGASPFRVFIMITLPLAQNGIFTATMLTWARCMGEFGGTLMVAGAIPYRTETLPIGVFLSVSTGQLGLAVGCALVLLGISFLSMFMMKLFLRK
ncbi:MAG: ABC transporter permease [Methermicoccaceae archaeon]